MLRGYWRVIFAIGLIALGSGGYYSANAKAHHKHRSQPEPPAAPIVHEASSASESAEHAQGCEGSRNPKIPCDAISADASTDQTFYALLQAIFSFVGVLVGGGTLYAAVWAAKWAKVAAKETAKSADAAINGLSISSVAIDQSAQHFAAENRPWIAIEDIKARVTTTNIGGHFFLFAMSYNLKNYGNTPAVAVHDLVVFGKKDELERVSPDFFKTRFDNAPTQGFVIFPNEVRKVGATDGTHGDRGVTITGGERSVIIEVMIAVTYRDGMSNTCMSTKKIRLCQNGSTPTSMTYFMLDSFTPDEFVDAAVIEDDVGNHVI